jgi:hypothetical protein
MKDGILKINLRVSIRTAEAAAFQRKECGETELAMTSCRPLWEKATGISIALASYLTIVYTLH